MVEMIPDMLDKCQFGSPPRRCSIMMNISACPCWLLICAVTSCNCLGDYKWFSAHKNGFFLVFGEVMSCVVEEVYLNPKKLCLDWAACSGLKIAAAGFRWTEH
jgi:hypothetical protein